VLVICDEHHHAAIEAAWGESANSAFAAASYVLILTGTPVRSDGARPIWLEHDRFGSLTFAEEGSYTLTYGDAVNLGYCRPVTFHRHHGAFTVRIENGDKFDVSGQEAAQVPKDHPGLRHLQKSLDFYRVAKKPLYEADGKTPQRDSFHGTMIEAASAQLDDLREEMPEAAGLVIAPDIAVAETFRRLIQMIEGEPAMIVHCRIKSADRCIRMFRSSKSLRWLVSVGMISEGVDIPRLRVLVYLPNGTTELLFRQAVGRVVRSTGPHDHTRAYVVMPAFATFDDYARRIEADMPASSAAIEDRPRFRRCPDCKEDNVPGATECSHCGHTFPERKTQFRSCEDCGHRNILQAEKCANCNVPVVGRYEITVREALRSGVISRGIDIDEEAVLQSEAEAPLFRERLRRASSDEVARLVSTIPKELLPAVRRFLTDDTADEIAAGSEGVDG
jgi:superfamily II DNA or RNA helicase